MIVAALCLILTCSGVGLSHGKAARRLPLPCKFRLRSLRKRLPALRNMKGGTGITYRTLDMTTNCYQVKHSRRT